MVRRYHALILLSGRISQSCQDLPLALQIPRTCLSPASARTHNIYTGRCSPPLPPYNGLPRPAWGGGWGWGRPQRVLYILYVQAGTKLSPDVPMKFIRESLGTRTPMERGNSKLLREPCVFWTPR